MYTKNSREDLWFMGRKKQKIKKVLKAKTNDIKALKCPCCGATLPLSDSKSTTCSYCGVSVILSDNLLIFDDEQSKKMAQDKSIIQEYVPDDELAPSIEELDSKNRQNHRIIRIKKNDKIDNGDKDAILLCLGITAIGSLSFYLADFIEPKNNTLMTLRLFLGLGLMVAVIGVLGTGYFIADSVSRRLEEKKYVEEGKIK